MKLSQLASLLRVTIPARRPTLAVASPGVGKTSIVHQVAEQLGYALRIIHGVISDPTDIKGLPFRSADGTAADFLPFAEWKEICETDKPTVVFLDDLGQTPLSVQAPLMQALHARRVNNRRISDTVSFIAATNRSSDRAGVNGILSPLLDRFTGGVVHIDFDVDDWVAHVLQNNGSPILASFARFRSELINAFDPAAAAALKRSPTPRAWFEGVQPLLDTNMINAELIGAQVGEGAAAEFVAFYQLFTELPDREVIYKSPKSAPVPDKKPDVMYALMGALAHGCKRENVAPTFEYLDRCPVEFNVLFVKDVAARDAKLIESPEWVAAFTKWGAKNAKALGV